MSNPGFPKEPKYKEFVLERIAFYSRQHLPYATLGEAENPLLLLDYTAESLVMTMRAFLVGRQEQQVISYPANWWEAIKDRFFPEWLRHRFPILWTLHRIQAIEILPEVKWPKGLGSTFRILVVEKEEK